MFASSTRACVRRAVSFFVLKSSPVVTTLRDVDGRHDERLYAWKRRETEDDTIYGRYVETRRAEPVKRRLGAG